MTDRHRQLSNVFRYGAMTKTDIDGWLRGLRGNPSPRESKFDVTAIGQANIGGVKDYFFAGVNAEQVPHRLSVHGEDGVIAAIATGLGKYAFIQSVHVMAAPKGLEQPTKSPMGDIDVPCCGKCRQNIFERAANPNINIRAISLNGNHERTATIAQLLPDAFGFADFNVELQKAKTEGANRITPPDDIIVGNRLMRFKPQSENSIFEWLTTLEPAAFASGIDQSVVMRLKDGTYVAGVKTEDAAYTGLSAIQSATAIAITADGYHKSREIEEVWAMTRDESKKTLQTDEIQGLALSDIQILREFGAKTIAPVHLYSADGDKITIPLSQSVHYAPTYDRPAIFLH